MVLNRAARVMSAGHGGQILLDGATAGLLAGVDLVDLGSRRLRDIAKPVEIFQVRADGLRAEFPPLKTLDPTPGNLEPQTTSFIGREIGTRRVGNSVKANRLVTLTGVGGVGKTRLALEVAARLKRFPRRGLGDRAGAGRRPRRSTRGDCRRSRNYPAARDEFGGQRRGGLGGQVATTGIRQLRARPRCSGGPDRDDPAALVDGARYWPRAAKGSRVADEQLWPVPSLDVAPESIRPQQRCSSSGPRHVAPEIHCRAPMSADAVVEICRRLDGMPLAIELAASRTAVHDGD